jgi:hypothetical protein
MNNKAQVGLFNPANIPTRKVGAGALAGALSFLVIWVINTFILNDHTLITGEAASALTTVLTFVVSYWVQEA